jgi:hypothetical protein
MSAAARPKRWGDSRQAKGRESDSTMVELFRPTYLTGRGYLGLPGKARGKRNDASDGSELITTDFEITLPSSPDC